MVYYIYVYIRWHLLGSGHISSVVVIFLVAAHGVSIKIGKQAQLKSYTNCYGTTMKALFYTR